MINVLAGHFKCPENRVKIGVAGAPSSPRGYFSFGSDVTCFGRTTHATPAARWQSVLPDTAADIRMDGDRVLLPFDLNEVASNFWLEHYCPTPSSSGARAAAKSAVRKLYYFMRPLLGVSTRKHLQRMNLRGWDKVGFPRWPVDFTVENLLEKVLVLILQRTETREIPFIWFWPEGNQACVMMTHDIEGTAGLKFSDQLMSIDESFGIRSAFQLVPEERYARQPGSLQRFTQRGFEVNVHDLNHDGTLFSNKEEFVRRAARINRYAQEFGTRGFRAGAMYRKQDWFDLLDFSYDMSVPNVAHLEPQHGGCCTVFPYFIGKILELPLTATQDYSLFHILRDYSIDLWKQQIEMITKRNGLISFIVHPDYIMKEREQRVYRELLTHLTALREPSNLWFALPGEINSWWRNRAQMGLVQRDGEWRIVGPDSDRARIAFASVQDGRIVYRVQ
jgi:hypothetical protein